MVLCQSERRQFISQTSSEVGSGLLSYLETDPLFVGQKHLLEHSPPRPYLLAWHSLPERVSSLLRTLHGHTNPVNGCAVSANGRFIASASSDKTLKVGMFRVDSVFSLFLSMMRFGGVPFIPMGDTW